MMDWLRDVAAMCAALGIIVSTVWAVARWAWRHWWRRPFVEWLATVDDVHARVQRLEAEVAAVRAELSKDD